uniref:Uncharacterized protein n=1 Tax=Branchiostoma floridae TaxID=7739 RepID=C3ZE79_BRAFL|eukprot:XP_002593024.1 hypothetical protein BRAFLDRAFT_74343 [Branchiostoma floridae]
MSDDTDTLITPSESDRGPAHKNGVWKGAKNVLGRSRGLLTTLSQISSRQTGDGRDWQANFPYAALLSGNYQQDDEDTMPAKSPTDDAEESNQSDQNVLEERDEQKQRDGADRRKSKSIDRILVCVMALPFWWRELVKANRVIEDLRRRLMFACGRVRQHEEKLRRILSKLAQLDSDVYDLENPKDVHLLHRNWKDLYDDIEAWLGGPEAAMTSDSSDTEQDSETENPENNPHKV